MLDLVSKQQLTIIKLENSAQKTEIVYFLPEGALKGLCCAEETRGSSSNKDNNSNDTIFIVENMSLANYFH